MVFLDLIGFSFRFLLNHISRSSELVKPIYAIAVYIWIRLAFVQFGKARIARDLLETSWLSMTSQKEKA